MPGWKIKPEDFRRRTAVLSDLYVTDRREGVCCVQRQPALTHKAFLSALALSRRPARYKEGRGAENRALAIGTESAAEPTGGQQQNGKKDAFLPRRQTCSHQR